MFEYHLIAVDPETGARAGEFVTPHGVIPTPVFMPVGPPDPHRQRRLSGVLAGEDQ